MNDIVAVPQPIAVNGAVSHPAVMREITTVRGTLAGAKRALWRRINDAVEARRQEDEPLPAGQARAEAVLMIRANALLEAHARGDTLDPADWPVLDGLVGVERPDGTAPSNALEVARAIAREAMAVAQNDVWLTRVLTVAKRRIKSATSVAELRQVEADARDALSD